MRPNRHERVRPRLPQGTHEIAPDDAEADQDAAEERRDQHDDRRESVDVDRARHPSVEIERGGRPMSITVQAVDRAKTLKRAAGI